MMPKDFEDNTRIDEFEEIRAELEDLRKRIHNLELETGISYDPTPKYGSAYDLSKPIHRKKLYGKRH